LINVIRDGRALLAPTHGRELFTIYYQLFTITAFQISNLKINQPENQGFKYLRFLVEGINILLE